MTTRIAAALAVLGFSAVAHARIEYNGPQINGAQINGAQINGAQINGAQINGAQINGAQINGINLSGISVHDGTFAATANIIGTSQLCAHSEGVQGNPLASSCSACAQRVCSYDPYCCTNSWDSICTSEVNNETQCTAYPISGANLVGSWFPVTVYNADNTARTTWIWIYGSQYNAWTGKTAYNVNYWSDAYYDSSGYHAGTWYNNLCPYSSKDSTYGTGSNSTNGALMVAGMWESRFGKFTSRFNSQTYYGGGKVAGAPSGSFSFVCRDVGALAKCLERDGISDTRSGDTYGACVRMTRADFCGNGLSFTSDGVLLDVWDNWSGQSFRCSGYGCWDGTYAWYDEASWSAKGATWVAADTKLIQTRTAAPTSPYGGITFMSFYSQYGATQCQYSSGYTMRGLYYQFSGDTSPVQDRRSE